MKILTDLQELALKTLFACADVQKHFYLTGGTALSAFYLQHRFSDDLDLFTHDISIDSIEPIVEDALKSAGLIPVKVRASPTFRRYLINDKLQLDLVRDVEQRIGAPILFDGIMIDTKKNIAVNKVLAIYGRLDPKDYVDMFFLLQGSEFNILDLLAAGKQKDAGLEPFQWAKVASDVESIFILPKMVVPCDLKELKSFFNKLRNEVIDSLNPSK